MALTKKEKADLDNTFGQIRKDLKQTDTKHRDLRTFVSGIGSAITANALNSAFSSGENLSVFIPTIIIADRPIILPLGNREISGHLLTIDASGQLGQDKVLTIAGNGSGNPYNQTAGLLSKLKLIGPGVNNIGEWNSIVGLYLHSNQEPGISHQTFDRLNISGFGDAITFGNNAYIINFSGCDIMGNNRGVYVPQNVENTGEGIRFTNNSTIANNQIGIECADGETGIVLSNSSLDYNRIHAKITAGGVSQFGGWIEGGTYTEPPISVTGNGAYFKLFGAEIIGQAANPEIDYFFYVGENAKIRLLSPHPHNQKTLTNFLCDGPGSFSATDRTYYDNTLGAIFTHKKNNRFCDGDVSNNGILDMISVGGAGTRISPTSVTNTKIEVSTLSATPSLKFTKDFGSGTDSSLNIYHPVSAGLRCVGQILLKRETGTTGIIFPTYTFHGGNMTQSVNGYSFAQNISIGGPNLDLATLNTIENTSANWNVHQWGGSNAFEVPAWATHFSVSFNCVLMGTGAFFVKGLFGESW